MIYNDLREYFTDHLTGLFKADLDEGIRSHKQVLIKHMHQLKSQYTFKKSDTELG